MSTDVWNVELAHARGAERQSNYKCVEVELVCVGGVERRAKSKRTMLSWRVSLVQSGQGGSCV